MSNYEKQIATEFAEHSMAKGFIVYMAESGTYGFLTDDTGKRVLSFGIDFGSIKLSGNYKHGSREIGSGWRMERTVSAKELTRDQISQYLNAHAPQWALRGYTGKIEYATLESHLKAWGPSSKPRRLSD